MSAVNIYNLELKKLVQIFNATILKILLRKYTAVHEYLCSQSSPNFFPPPTFTCKHLQQLSFMIHFI